MPNRPANGTESREAKKPKKESEPEVKMPVRFVQGENLSLEAEGETDVKIHPGYDHQTTRNLDKFRPELSKVQGSQLHHRQLLALPR